MVFSKKINSAYRNLVIGLVLLPNIFVVILGIESFPYTCAPMFGHYINEETNLYLFQFEGIKNGNTINLNDYFGKPEDYFMRHFFSKVYGSTNSISPFTNKLSESKPAFQHRMDTFFEHYTTFLKSNFNITLNKINIKVVEVNQNREVLSPPQIIGYYDTDKSSYISKYKKL